MRSRLGGLSRIVDEKMSRKDVINIRIDKTVPAGLNVTKRVCNENCIFDSPTGARCNDDLFLNEQGTALSNEDFIGLVERVAETAEKRVRVHIAGDGEPTLLNMELVQFVRMLKGSTLVHSIKLTTNGTMLSIGNPSLAQRLHDAGLDSLNVSLHTLNPMEFKEITGIDALNIVLRGIDCAVAAGIKTSVNCVLRPSTLGELESFMELSRSRGITVKFFHLLSNRAEEQKRYDALLDKLKFTLAGMADQHKSYDYPYDGSVYLVNGAVVDIKDSRVNVCPNLSCGYRSRCIEGCRYEARLSRTGILQPCGVRDDNKLDLAKRTTTQKEIASALASGGKL